MGGCIMLPFRVRGRVTWFKPIRLKGAVCDKHRVCHEREHHNASLKSNSVSCVSDLRVGCAPP